jgi:hypothetical protein
MPSLIGASKGRLWLTIGSGGNVEDRTGSIQFADTNQSIAGSHIWGPEDAIAPNHNLE